ncbi:MAG TPA: signal peptidase II, partial [Longimicrobiales bacterium]
MLNRKWPLFGLTMATIVVLDLVTKAWAVRTLEFGHTVALLGVPMTLTFNTGAAFSLSVGDASRWFFLCTNTIALGAMLVFFHRTELTNKAQLVALTLLSSGAVGNIIDRIRWEHGVVDFIGPINLGVMFWPVFNLADSAITCGALLLAAALWRSDRHAE